MSAYDAIVVGGGHNGLTAAAYLARAGLRVLVLERLSEVGGAAVSAAPFKGRPEKISRYAYLVSLLPRAIARDLGIDVELRRRRLSAFAPAGGDRRALIVDDPPTSERTRASLGPEHEAWIDFDAMAAEVGARLFPTLTEPLRSRDEARALLADVPGAWEALVERPIGATLRERFRDGLVRGVVSTDAVIGTLASVDDPSLRQNRCMMWHLIGGAWRVPVGGMGAITAALAASARDAGAELRTGVEVTALEHGPRTSEVRWDGGSASARFVLAGVAPATLAALEGLIAPETAPGSQTKLNMLLDRLPRLRGGTDPQDAFAGTFRLNEHEDDIEAAYRAARRGELSERLPAELYCASLTDRRPGAHALTLFGLHTPHGAPAERYLDALDEHLDEPIRECIARDAAGAPCIEAHAPADLERDLAMPRGNIFHGDLDWPWAEGDAEAGPWGAETGHPRTFLCGAGARRGGGVSCVGGHNAAMAVLARV